MKKLAAILLAGVMCLGMSTSVFAGVSYTSTDAKSNAFQITKTYSSDEDYVPAETLNFTVTAATDNPDGGTAKIVVGTNNTFTVSASKDTTSQTFTNSIPVALPSYSKAGVYVYTIKEVEGTTAGVTYDKDKTITVNVLVEYDNTNNKLVIEQTEYVIKNSDGTKTKTFENSFDTGNVSVAKNVTGNMADKNDEFTINYTLSTNKSVLTDVKVGGQTISKDEFKNGTYTGTITISAAGGAKTFADLPKDMVVTIGEDLDEDGKSGNYTFTQIAVDGIVKSTTVGEGENAVTTNDKTAEITVGDETSNAVVITNNYGRNVDTGINMDSVPYIVICGIVVLGAAVVLTKKRFSSED